MARVERSRPSLRPAGLFRLGAGHLAMVVITGGTYLAILTQFQQAEYVPGLANVTAVKASSSDSLAGFLKGNVESQTASSSS